MRIGIDVGGTNTDAALIGDGGEVLATVKSPTTEDVTGGVAAALAGLGATQVSAVMIGTTHFVNALVEAARLEPVAAVRLGLPATAALPPMVDWPERLRKVVEGASYLCHGGHEYDGTPISELDPEELRRVAADIRARGLRSVAISSVFSPSATPPSGAPPRSSPPSWARRRTSPSPARSAASACWPGRTPRS
ncbi:hydantoinase/oxoprolinase N-terminal domain-containing protein [Nonomuraea recticatena]|uniref:hydantoinase/oxoprolinase N-terminal domain-containing protein n=1 Tax=Nonomuraea recticatena TaxID=46178 RepID=UPI00361C5CC9